MKNIPLILALLTLLSVPAARAAEQTQSQAVVEEGNALAAADANGGYSGEVLAKISRLWTPPPDTISRRVAVRLNIDGEGNLEQCVLMTRSDMPEMNRAACAAAKEAGNFGVPPYGMPIEVYVTFWTGKPSKNSLGGKPVDAASKPTAPRQVVIPTPNAASAAPQQKPTTKSETAQSVTAKPDAKASAPKPATQPEAKAKPEAKAADKIKPEAKAADKTAAAPTRRGGLSGDDDTATTPIKSSSSKDTPAASAAAPKASAPKPGKPVADASKKEPAPKGVGKKDRSPQEKAKPEADKKSPAQKNSKPDKPAGVRTDFAPYRDPRAKPDVEKPVQTNAEQRRYAAEVTAMIQARIMPPAKVPSGKYTMSVTVNVDGTGNVSEAELSRSSGQPLLDEAALRTVLRMEKVNPPPGNQSRDLKLTLTIHKP